MILLACLASLIGLPVLAYRGAGYRGLYFAGTVAALLLGFAFMALADAGPVDTSPEQLAAAAFMYEYFPLIGGWLMLTGVAALIAGAMFRPASTVQGASPSRHL